MADRKDSTTRQLSRRVRLRIGQIYVNGWASQGNPHHAGVYIGRQGRNAKIFYPDGKSGLLDPRALVPASELWSGHHFQAECDLASGEKGEIASRYAQEVLWPLDYDDETKEKAGRGEYVPPTFEEWLAKGATSRALSSSTDDAPPNLAVSGWRELGSYLHTALRPTSHRRPGSKVAVSCLAGAAGDNTQTSLAYNLIHMDAMSSAWGEYLRFAWGGLAEARSDAQLVEALRGAARRLEWGEVYRASLRCCFELFTDDDFLAMGAVLRAEGGES